MADPFIGQINLFAGNFAPRSYALCMGQLLQIAQNTALFSILGTTFGGDGRTTFGLPNLQERAPMHPGSGPGLTHRFLGEVGGSDTVPLNEMQIPAHGHGALAGGSPDSNTPAPTRGLADTSIWAAPSTPDAVMSGLAIGDTGDGTPHENRQPFLALNFIIALQGTYPPRS